MAESTKVRAQMRHSRAQGLAHKVETAVLVDEFHNGHGAHEEEERGGRGAKVVLDDAAHGEAHGRGVETGHVLCGVDHEDRPAQHEHEQSNGRLVDFGHTLEGDAKIAGAKYGHDTQA